jgi:hypothetical protein
MLVKLYGKINVCLRVLHAGRKALPEQKDKDTRLIHGFHIPYKGVKKVSGILFRHYRSRPFMPVFGLYVNAVSYYNRLVR